MTGFQNASITKGMMMILGINTLTASLLDIKPYLHLQLVPHISKYNQYWRVLIHPFAFANSTELLVGLLLLYNVGVTLERSFGPRKLASFILISSITSTLLSSVTIILFHKIGINSIPSGPYGLLFSLLWQHYRTIPNLYTFRISGITFTNQIFTHLLAIQLVLSHPPGSILASTTGLIAGYLYRTDLLLHPPFFRRYALRPLKSYRLPTSVYTLLSRVFAPLVGESTAPRRGNRVLPGQSSGAAAVGGGSALRSLWNGRIGAGGGAGGGGAGEGRRGTAQGVVQGSVVVPRTEGARAVVGEFVSEMTGRGGARAPTEGEISVLSGMFPNLGREAVVRALQRNDYNTAQAVEALLQESS